ncbi:MAG TPA: 16S rRNA (adenine(1518)-N(6)/adenine(1519)-N(6))-dimethyltransferase RsmA [Steroidobacteraceae bacterium]|jgi:16S rRNA (adenine1518-N6/adenine1519-N6)-dimethyltransferase|nr:16S rRNA (adenine(1518)-N(6)/adenine(1519)-N(6))-dimethyltransferase RsmA [Steroidobacteraceae bacterium]
MPVRKRFGQHFLHDRGVIRRIIDAVSPAEGEHIVEIGPGRGALTWDLLQRAHGLDVIEIDRDLAQSLKNDARAAQGLRVHVEDALQTDFTRLRADGAALRIVGNLPYNISTPLLFRLLSQRGAVADMHFMLQKEVVDRMTAEPSNKTYGRLTVMLAAVAEVEKLFDVGPGAFQPRPKVWSAIVRLRPSLEPRFDIGAHGVLRLLVTAAFSHRRKILSNGLKGFLTAEEIQSCGIDSQLRPEALTPAQFGLLAAHYSRLYSNEHGRLRENLDTVGFG